MQTKNKEHISAARDNLLNMANLLQTVLDGGKNLSAAAEESGMSLNGFRNSCLNGFTPYIKKQLLSVDDLCLQIRALYTPGERCLFDVFGYDTNRHVKNQILYLPDFDEEQFWEDAKKLLKEQQYYVTANYYGYQLSSPLTLAEIATRMGLSASNVSTHHRNALRKLRRPSFLKQLWPAISPAMGASITMMKAATEHAIRAYQDTLADYQKAETLANYTEALAEAERILSRSIPADKIKQVKSGDILLDTAIPVPISEAGFSIRAFNALNRAHIKTLNELIGKTRSEVIAIRNLGKHSYEEIQAAMLKYFNYTFRDDTDNP